MDNVSSEKIQVSNFFIFFFGGAVASLEKTRYKRRFLWDNHLQDGALQL